ncbi:Permease of the drug/metabolite transporter (DMT) superfamily [Winogradskyella psychrotolerans RS-3]|uniref:Permease of the drug/metabolite transporter (DMT) superfamily n=1 Tax=Winogradskyella psychrotolerans RS-3 TaxID=641526 RepID=S7VQF9_9FLAO|nr:EamA family transporter [Winogradskyella psychrotolerans]EPR72495.1 Permease of the drug/metabolite transporter (DMT) superfamily [Winogradskyella psychrotolerans RS-3]
MKLTKERLYILLAFFSIYVIWGSTYLLNKILVSQLAPLYAASIRFITASILIFTIAKFLKIPLKITKRQLRNTAIAGFLFLTIGNGLVVWALKSVDSGFAALEISAQPLVVLILLRILEGKKIQPMSILGVVIGCIGIYLLVSQREMIGQEGMVTGMIMIFICMLSWAYCSLFVSKADLPSNFFVNTGYQMLFGGAMLLIGSLIAGEERLPFSSWNTEIINSMGMLIIFGSIVAFTAFNYLLSKVSPEKVATSTYVNPIVALILGWYFLDETFSAQSIIAAAVLLTGVYFINTKKTITLFKRFKKEI